MSFSAFGITNRKRTPASVKRIGYKAFIEPSAQVRAYIGDYLNDNIFSINCDHVLGTSSQVTADEATMYYNGSNFIDKNGEVVFIRDYDRIIIAMTTQNISIVFPDKFLILKNFVELDMNGYDITIPGRVDGELNLTNAGSDLNISGQAEALIVNWSLITINFTGSGSIISNGVLTTPP